MTQTQAQTRIDRGHGAVVIGAGPAGLAAAYTLARAGRPVTVIERGDAAGGLASSFDHEGFIFDYGPHFYTPGRPGVQELWDEVLGHDQVFLRRKTRMYWKGHYFDYPPRLGDFVRHVGVAETAALAASFVGARLRRGGAAENLATRMKRRFGPKIFATCFKAYVEKLFGVPCEQLSPEWQPGRLRDSSALATLRACLLGDGDGVLPYPRLGSRQFYQGIAERVGALGHPVRFGREVVSIEHEAGRVVRMVTRPRGGGGAESIDCASAHVFSSMPLGLLLKALSPELPAEVPDASASMRFRNTVLVFLVVDGSDLFEDHCIYVNDARVDVGRVTNFANWSPGLSPDPRLTAVCCEYWCDEGADHWAADDASMADLARDELRRLGLLGGQPVMSRCVRRLPRTHPIPTLGPRREVWDYLAHFRNLEPIGRAGSFSYQDQDDSILMGIRSAKALIGS